MDREYCNKVRHRSWGGIHGILVGINDKTQEQIQLQNPADLVGLVGSAALHPTRVR